MTGRFTRGHAQKVKAFLTNVDAGSAQPSREQLDNLVFDLEAYNRPHFVAKSRPRAQQRAVQSAARPYARPGSGVAAALAAAFDHKRGDQLQEAKDAKEAKDAREAQEAQEAKASEQAKEVKEVQENKIVAFNKTWPALADESTGIKYVEGDRIAYSDDLEAAIRSLAAPSTYMNREPYLLTGHQLDRGLIVVGPFVDRATGARLYEVQHIDRAQLGLDKRIAVFGGIAVQTRPSLNLRHLQDSKLRDVVRHPVHAISQQDMLCSWHYKTLDQEGKHIQVLPRDGYPAPSFKGLGLKKSFYMLRLIGPQSPSELVKYAILRAIDNLPSSSGIDAQELAVQVFAGHASHDPRSIWISGLLEELVSDGLVARYSQAFPGEAAPVEMYKGTRDLRMMALY